MDIRTDRNYAALRAVWNVLDKKIDYDSAPPEVIDVILDAKDLLEEACRIYEFVEDETDTGN